LPRSTRERALSRLTERGWRRKPRCIVPRLPRIPRMLPRLFLRLLVLLGAGVFVTVCTVVAIALSVNVFGAPPVFARSTVDEVEWSVSRHDGFGAARIISSRRVLEERAVATSAGPPEAIVPAWLDLDAPFLAGETLSRTDAVDLRGWPWPAAWCRVVHMQFTSSGPPVRLGMAGGIKVTNAQWADPWTSTPLMYRERIVPLRPIWSGLALNSIVFSIAFAITAALFFELRRRCRLRSGRCVACGYRVRDQPRCPECGRPAAVRQSQSEHFGIIA